MELQGSRKLTILIIAGIILYSAVLAGLVFIYTGSIYSRKVQTSLSVPSVVSKQDEDLEYGRLIASGSASYASAKYQALSQFKEDLRKVLNGEVEYAPDPNKYFKEDIYISEIRIPYQRYEDRLWNKYTHESGRDVVIIARKYTPGFVATMGYEGSEWKVDFDEWVQFLQRLTPTTTKAIRVNSWGKGSEPLPILVKKWGEFTFGIYDSYFQPAGSYDRNFVTYDVRNKQIVEVIARDYFVEIEYQQGSAVNKYGDVTEELFSSVEDALANIASQH